MAVGGGVESDLTEGVAGIRVGLAVAVEEVGAVAVAVTTLVGLAVSVGAVVAGAVVAVGDTGSPTSDESPVQAASNNSPAASDTSATASKGQMVDSLLAMAGLPVYHHRLNAIGPPRSAGVCKDSVKLYVSPIRADCRRPLTCFLPKMPLDRFAVIVKLVAVRFTL